MAREYKDSGIEWIGQIPKEWNVCRLKNITTCLDYRRVPLEASMRKRGPYPYWGAGSIMDYVDDYIYDEELVLLGEDGAPFFDKTRDVAFYVNEKVWVNNHIHTLMPKPSLNAKYLTHYLNIVDYKTYINGSILNKLTQTNMNEINCILPSVPEQQKIADYLDKVCGEVDEMVALQEAMIDELKAYKQSVITEAVTKGLNPNVPMKNSGIDWIGEVPEHWNLHQFRRIFEIKKIIAGTLGYNVLSVTQNGIKVKDLTKNEGQIAQDYSKYQLVDVDDYVMNHMDLLTGYVDCSKQEGVTSPDYRVFRAIDKNQISLSYYLKIFQTCYKEKIFYHLGQGVSGMGRWRLPADQLKLFYLPMPPLSEQQSIASYLDTKCAEIDALIAIKQAKIEELKDYKKSVIYEYVTGKKEVV